jgi:phosphoribosylaminoimidazole-succinocarboxamide synthase
MEGQKIPDLNEEWINSVSKRYIELYERLTGIPFLPASSENIPDRIQENIKKFISNF